MLLLLLLRHRPNRVEVRRLQSPILSSAAVDSLKFVASMLVSEYQAYVTAVVQNSTLRTIRLDLLASSEGGAICYCRDLVTAAAGTAAALHAGPLCNLIQMELMRDALK
jgi:hypothetical protein